MRKKINTLIKHPLISGSAIIFIGSLLANFLNFLFNIFMSRNLSASDYGIVATLVSLLTIFALAADSFTPTIVRFAGSYMAKNDFGAVKDLFLKLTKLLAFFGLFIFVFFTVFSSQISQFFKIGEKYLIILVGFMIFLGFITLINRAFLQAKLDFKYIAFANFIGSFLKLSVGIILILIGLRALGVMGGFFLSFLASYLLTLIPIKFVFANKIRTSRVPLGTLFAYGAPAALALIGLTSYINMDILLVKHFFDPKTAGIYALLSLIGRIIFFLTAPITMAMFPLVVQKHTRNENFHGIFYLALLLIFIPSLVLTVFYFLLPNYIISIFIRENAYASTASSIAPYLGFFGIFITGYSLLSILTNFYLSIRKTKVFIPILLFALLQGILIWFYHKDFLQIITISTITTGLPLMMLLLYYWNQYGRKRI